MNDLDYEPKPPRPRREGPGVLEVVAWIATCLSGGLAGAATTMSLSLHDIACCGSFGGTLAIVLAVPLLVFAEHAPMWAKLLIGFVAAFALAGVLSFILIAMAAAG